MSHVVTVTVFELNIYKILNFYIITATFMCFFISALLDFAIKVRNFFFVIIGFIFLVNVKLSRCWITKYVLIDKLEKNC